MSLVLTLIAGPGAARTLPDLVAALAAALPLAGAPDWLAPGMACDLRLAGIVRTIAAGGSAEVTGWVLDASVAAVMGSLASACNIANSSPPKRATRSVGLTVFLSRCATCRRRASPIA